MPVSFKMICARVPKSRELRASALVATLLLPGCDRISAAWHGENAAPTTDNAAISHYTCPMHPSVHATEPGRCPICGMDLVPVSADQAASGVVHVDETQRKTYGIRSVAAELAPLVRTIRFAGKVDWDVSRQRDVSLRVSGTIEGLPVAVGSAVRRGDTLFGLRSPELSLAQADLLSGPNKVGARTRLAALGLSPDQISAIEVAGAPLEVVPILAPAAGVVREVSVVSGAAVAFGSSPVRLASADRVWILASLSEADAAAIPPGAKARVTISSQSGRDFVGRVAPLPAQEGVAQARVVVENADGALRPGALATVEVDLSSAPAVLVPADAVVYTGTRHIVFVDSGDGSFAPRSVQIGERTQAFVAILSGITAGERVVSDGTFLVAADSRIRAPEAWRGTP